MTVFLSMNCSWKWQNLHTETNCKIVFPVASSSSFACNGKGGGTLMIEWNQKLTGTDDFLNWWSCSCFHIIAHWMSLVSECENEEPEEQGPPFLSSQNNTFLPPSVVPLFSIECQRSFGGFSKNVVHIFLILCWTFEVELCVHLLPGLFTLYPKHKQILQN